MVSRFLNFFFFFLSHIDIHATTLGVILASRPSIITHIQASYCHYYPNISNNSLLFLPNATTLVRQAPLTPNLDSYKSNLLGVLTPVNAPHWQREFFHTEHLGTSLLCLYSMVVPHHLPNKSKLWPWLCWSNSHLALFQSPLCPPRSTQLQPHGTKCQAVKGPRFSCSLAFSHNFILLHDSD